VEGQLQVPGLEQAPPFAQTGEHTAINISRLIFFQNIISDLTNCTSRTTICGRTSTSTRTRTRSTIRTSRRTNRYHDRSKLESDSIKSAKTYALHIEYHYMSTDKCKYRDLNMFHHLHKQENTQLKSNIRIKKKF